MAVVVLCLFCLSHAESKSNAEKVNSVIRAIENLLKVVQLSDDKRKSQNIEEAINNASDDVSDWLAKNDVILAEKLHQEALVYWNYVTNLTKENADKASQIHISNTKWTGQKILEARRYLDKSSQIADPDIIRKLHIWVYGLGNPPPDDPKTLNDITELGMQLESIYSKAEVKKDGKVYRIEPELTQLMATSRDYDELKWAWQAWRDVSGPKIKQPFTELVSKLNEAATDNGLSDIGVSWRVANYYQDDIIPMVDQLYEDILPLYTELHAYVREKLSKYYNDRDVDPDGPIPAHILGNMWAQEWMDISDIVVPFPEVDSDDVTSAMIEQGYTPLRMFQLAEKFFTSLGLEPMTAKFWNLSMIVRPDDRSVVCHGSAEDFMTEDDFRIKMCTTVNGDDLGTVHHEMGHIEYFMQYRHLPTVYRSGANAAFHEAIGDTIALSVMTPEHLKKIGLYQNVPSEKVAADREDDSCFTSLKRCTTAQKRTLNQLMKKALEKIAFLPFGYLIDKWRWDVFSGKIDETNYNTKWWLYRTKYQGVAPPVERTENDFDPGSKYHVAVFVPYIRYFLSFIGQFQFHEALCHAKHHNGPMYNCDIYQSKEAGDLLKSVLSLGMSKPWQDVLEQFTGQRHFSTEALYKYFSPLYSWLQAYNRKNGIKRGWSTDSINVM